MVALRKLAVYSDCLGNDPTSHTVHICVARFLDRFHQGLGISLITRGGILHVYIVCGHCCDAGSAESCVDSCRRLDSDNTAQQRTVLS